MCLCYLFPEIARFVLFFVVLSSCLRKETQPKQNIYMCLSVCMYTAMNEEKNKIHVLSIHSTDNQLSCCVSPGNNRLHFDRCEELVWRCRQSPSVKCTSIASNNSRLRCLLQRNTLISRYLSMAYMFSFIHIDATKHLTVVSHSIDILTMPASVRNSLLVMVVVLSLFVLPSEGRIHRRGLRMISWIAMFRISIRKLVFGCASGVSIVWLSVSSELWRREKCSLLQTVYIPMRARLLLQTRLCSTIASDKSMHSWLAMSMTLNASCPVLYEPPSKEKKRLAVTLDTLLCIALHAERKREGERGSSSTGQSDHLKSSTRSAISCDRSSGEERVQISRASWNWMPSESPMFELHSTNNIISLLPSRGWNHEGSDERAISQSQKS